MASRLKSVSFIVLVFILSLFMISFEKSQACHLQSGTYYTDCVSWGVGCDTSGEVSAYDFAIDFGGCVMGYSAGQYYKPFYGGFGCLCEGPEAKWHTSPSYNGQICKRKSGGLCNKNVKEGVWDASESKCVICTGKIESEYFNCNGDYTGNQRCEYACGADERCDEVSPSSSLPDMCTSQYLEKNRYCDSDCQYSSNKYYCSASNCGQAVSCGGQTYYCVYENGQWKWSTSKPANFCCGPSDCPGYDPGTHLKLYCDTDTHTCKPKPKCDVSSDCDNGYCCDTITGAKDCKAKGTILSSGGKSYLCDPPEGFINLAKEDTTNQARRSNLFDLLMNLLKSFLPFH